MDNPESLPQIKFPDVPDDFNGGVGVEFARELIRLLQGSQVIISVEQAQPIDVSQLQQDVEQLQDDMEDRSRKQRKITMAGVDNNEFVVPFETIGTVNYDVNATILIPTGNNPGADVGVYIIADTKQVSQFKARCDGLLSTYTIEFVVTEIKEGL